jgi:hypothetical protein
MFAALNSAAAFRAGVATSGAAQKTFCVTVHPDWHPATRDNVAAISRHLHRKETNMEKMETFAHPIELHDEELDRVAAGALVDVDVKTGDIAALNNIAVLSQNFSQSVKQ